jgi:outer membrane receptor protein involved in Fe transport
MRTQSSSPIFRLLIRMPLVLAVFSMAGTLAAAQSGHGIITGSATDRQGAVLQGAQVKVQPGELTVATDGQGEFTVTGVAPGTYTVTISYIGFSTFTQQVKVAAGQASHVEARMAVSAHSEEVTVIAERPHGEAEAINRQRTSDDILQVLPSDVITSLPNANIADAVGRLPSVTLERDEGEGKYVQIRGTEPRLNNTTIDGVNVPSPEAGVRQVKLDTIPADIVESVEVSKTLSANQDGDAIGGTVNLVTKSAGDLPTLILEGIGGLTPILNTRWIDQANGTIGQRFGAAKRFGALFSGSYDYNGRGINDIEPTPTAGSAIPLYDSIDLRDYRYKRTRYGFGGSLDYKLREGSGVYLHYFYSDFKDYGDKWVYTLNSGAAPGFSEESRLPDYGIGNLAIGGKHVFTNSWLSWEASVSRARQTAAAGNPGADFQPATNALNNLTSCVSLGSPDIHLPKWDPSCFGSPTFDPSQWSLLDVSLTSGNTSQVNLQGAISYARNYHVGTHFSTFEFGFKVRNAHKGQDAYSPTYDNPSAAAPLMTQFLTGLADPNYYFKAYTIGPFTSFGKITGDLNSLLNQGILSYDNSLTRIGSDASNYDLTERVSAAYAMNTIEFGRFRLQTGLRVEATQLNTRGYIVTNDANGNYISTAPATASAWYWDPMPSVQLRYRITDDSDIRAVYGRGISRPDPYDTIPYVTLDQSGSPPNVSIGNPNLKPEHANSYDLLYEHYLRPFGEIQGGFFYKQLSAPIYYIDNPNLSAGDPYYNQYPKDHLDYIINGVNAKLYGVEAAYIQHLGFLPGGLDGFGISANISWTGSSAGTLPVRNDDPSLQRQAPLTWNLSPTYDKGRFSARLGATYNSKSIFTYQWEQPNATCQANGNCEDMSNFGPKGPAGDIYLLPHLQVDAQASYRVQKSLTVLVQGLNLTDEVFGFYNGSPWYLIQREYYRPTYSFGLRWEPRREN